MHPVKIFNLMDKIKLKSLNKVNGLNKNINIIYTYILSNIFFWIIVIQFLNFFFFCSIFCFLRNSNKVLVDKRNKKSLTLFFFFPEHSIFLDT